MKPLTGSFLYCALLAVALAPAVARADFQATSPTTTETTTTNVDGSTGVKQVTHNPDGSTVTVDTVTYPDGTRTTMTTTEHPDGTQTVETTTVNPPAPHTGDTGYGNYGNGRNGGGNSGNGGFGQALANAATQALMQNMMGGGGFNPQQVMGSMVNGLTGGAAGVPATSALTTGSIHPAPGAMAASDATKALDTTDAAKAKKTPAPTCAKALTDEEKAKKAANRQAQLQGAPDGQREALNAKFEKEDADAAKLPKCPEVDYTKPNGVTGKITSLADAQALVGKQIGNGQCAVLAETLAPGIGRTATWQKGEQVMGNTDIPIGTAIATFNYQDGTAYAPVGSAGVSGGSHSAIYLGQNSTGVMVLNQWSSSGGARITTIPWNSWGGSAEAGNRYYVIAPRTSFNFILFKPLWLAWDVLPFSNELLQGEYDHA